MSSEIIPGMTAETSSAKSIFVYGKDVYIAGDMDDRTVYWKNGKPNVVGDPMTEFYGSLNSIVVVKR